MTNVSPEALPAAEGIPCTQYDPDQWHPKTGDAATAEIAKALCRTCVMQIECLEGALERGEKFGIWGGRDFEAPPGGRRRKPGRPRTKAF